MEMLAKVACLIVLCMVVIAPHAEAVTCGQVTGSLSSCIPYLRGSGALPPSCCNGVRGLNASAKTTPDRQTVCRCLVAASKSIKGINLAKASQLPGLCGVNIPYKIAPSTDCSRVQ